MSLSPLESNPYANKNTNSSTEIYTDLNSLQNLKQSAVKDSQAALPEVARQFEAVMITMMMKSLRQDGMEDPLFSSQAEDSYRDMYDQQLGLELSKGQGIGLAQSIIRQMQQSGHNRVRPESETPEASVILKMPTQSFSSHHYSQSAELVKQSSELQSTEMQGVDGNKNFNGHFDSPQDFVEKLWPMAEKAAEKLGVTADIIISQAALETGWGKHIIRTEENSSFNVFNIKANHGWDGERMEKSSLEFVQGKAYQQKSDFRAYASLEQSFDDYVNFLKDNPRYKNIFNKENKQEHLLHDLHNRDRIRIVKAENSYIEKLQKAGYATDPAYSDKVLQVLNSDVIQSQLQKQIKIASKEINDGR